MQGTSIVSMVDLNFACGKRGYKVVFLKPILCQFGLVEFSGLNSWQHGSEICDWIILKKIGVINSVLENKNALTNCGKK